MFLNTVILGLAKDVSSYNESSLKQELLELAKVVKLFQTPLSSSGEQRAGSPYASRKPPRCWEPRTYAGGRGGARPTEFDDSVEAV